MYTCCECGWNGAHEQRVKEQATRSMIVFVCPECKCEDFFKTDTCPKCSAPMFDQFTNSHHDVEKCGSPKVAVAFSTECG